MKQLSFLSKVVCWFSCGITSAVACKLALDKFGKDNCELIYFDIESAHPDNKRFIKDCEKWYGKKIIKVSNPKFKDQFDVIKKTRYINGPAGARCTLELKKEVRYKLEKELNIQNQIFGFEYSKKEINRAVRFLQQNPSTKPYFPLIEAKLNKDECAYIILRAGIELPVMYLLGFLNNNCIGCVKGGKAYWNKIRKWFPKFFKRMKKHEKLIGRSCIKGTFLKDLKEDEGRNELPILPDCGPVCEIEFADVIDKRTEMIMNGDLNINDLVGVSI